MENFEQTSWWKYLDGPMRDLAAQSVALLEQESGRVEEYKYHDYSYIVFPMAKAYEGFLKKLFFEMGLITKRQYRGDRFRIGKALNPHLPKRYQWDWVYAKLVLACRGEQLPLTLWETWKKARNRIFHYFPDHHEFISLERAEELVGMITGSMEMALEGCGVGSIEDRRSSLEARL